MTNTWAIRALRTLAHPGCTYGVTLLWRTTMCYEPSIHSSVQMGQTFQESGGLQGRQISSSLEYCEHLQSTLEHVLFPSTSSYLAFIPFYHFVFIAFVFCSCCVCHNPLLILFMFPPSLLNPHCLLSAFILVFAKLYLVEKVDLVYTPFSSHSLLVLPFGCNWGLFFFSFLFSLTISCVAWMDGRVVNDCMNSLFTPQHRQGERRRCVTLTS